MEAVKLKSEIEAMKSELEAELQKLKHEISTADIREYYRNIAKQKNPQMEQRHRRFFAKSLSEINLETIEPELIVCESKEQKALFNSALSFWSVPVSSGYGRRINIIVFDKKHNKVMGVAGLCDPIFAMSVRDDFIGWNQEQRQMRLYNVLTAYVLGAVPPYNRLYGAKLIAQLIGSKEVVEHFKEKYKDAETVIKKRKPVPVLAVIDTMAFYGQSAIYHQLKEWAFVGYTQGITHHHIPQHVWNIIFDIAKELKIRDEKLWDFKNSNVKLYIVRDVLRVLHISNDVLRTTKRGYYFRPLIANWREFLLGQTDEPIYTNKTADEYVAHWKSKWLQKAVRKLHTASTIAV